MPRALCRANFFHPCLYCRLCYPPRGTSRSPGTDCRQFLEFKRTLRVRARAVELRGHFSSISTLASSRNRCCAAVKAVKKSRRAWPHYARFAVGLRSLPRAGVPPSKSPSVVRSIDFCHGKQPATINPPSSKSVTERATPLSPFFFVAAIDNYGRSGDFPDCTD